VRETPQPILPPRKGIEIMLTAGDFKNGVTFEKDGQVCQVIEFQHVKPGKGAAFVRTQHPYRALRAGTR